ncbi:hypothetical protein [Cryptosporangium arvum]|uniref:Uncharacterized protein n=1 Tax=Cryptosporangium arvum DSM 44712 TaxID=927661 RepID=A0A010YXU1_9ACTN|nr:hypothetical protein [Cryptosporangium arvum]EXG80023.1 hypothetical protein CryarDRAFT_1082 [Cryptosporangium arvum DSM 44712]
MEIEQASAGEATEYAVVRKYSEAVRSLGEHLGIAPEAAQRALQEGRAADLLRRRRPGLRSVSEGVPETVQSRRRKLDEMQRTWRLEDLQRSARRPRPSPGEV